MKNKLVERFVPEDGQEWLQNFYNKIITHISDYSKNKIILDAGCGSGYTERKLAKIVKKIDAYDISTEALNYAKKQLSNNKVIFSKKDFNKDSFKKDYYDVALSIEVIEHLSKPNKYLKNIYDSLKKNGILILSTPNKKLTTTKNPYHIKEYTYSEMITLFKKNNFQKFKTIGIAPNTMSNVAVKAVPSTIINLIKKIPFYKKIVDIFFNFNEEKNPEKANSIIYFCQKA